MANQNQFTVAGVDFRIHYDLPRVRDIRRESGVDILTDDGVRTVASNLIDFAEFLWHSCRPQAERAGISEAQFIDGITDQMDLVTDCWLEAIGDFFDRARRSALARLARGVVEVEREDRADVNDLLDESTARKLTRKSLKETRARRRAALADALGGEDENEPNDQLTPGAA